MSEERKGIGEGRVIDRPIHHRLRVINEGVDFSRPSHESRFSRFSRFKTSPVAFIQDIVFSPETKGGGITRRIRGNAL